jgi:hypothetical protein
MLRKFDADLGKVWKSKLTGDELSETLYLGKQDTIDNYEQINIEDRGV